MKHLPNFFLAFGLFCIATALVIFIGTFYQVIFLEIGYSIFRPNPNTFVSVSKKDTNAIHPIDTNFSIVIPKIGANAKIIPGVDPYNSAAYQVALTKGVAQAKGTALPYEKGNMFVFSHSAANFYDATHYNAIFYLLSKLKKDDKIYVFYKGQKYTYVVSTTKLVSPKDVSYLENKTNDQTLTLMTCWPAGTSLNRLLVLARQLPSALPSQ